MLATQFRPVIFGTVEQPLRLNLAPKVCRSMASQVLDSKSEPPPLFDGTTRLYISSRCPYAQRVWIARNYKGLDEIEIVEISLTDKPSWYKEKVYPLGKVPALEHDKKVVGESIDLLYYLEEKFGGSKIFPADPVRYEAAQALIKSADNFNKAGFSSLSIKDANPQKIKETFDPELIKLETALGRFAADGPFFLGNFSAVDIVYVPFVERFHLALSGLKDFDITTGRPNLTKWIEAINKEDAYTQTKVDSQVLLEIYRKMLENDYFVRMGVAANPPVPSNA